jgi:transcriptional regulator with GAF, ATPase, and Fis domain
MEIPPRERVSLSAPLNEKAFGDGRVIDYHAIGRLLLEAGRLSNDDYARALRESKETGKSLHEILLKSDKVSVDELVQALAIHMDMTLLREALGLDAATLPKRSFRPLGSYLERISLLFKMGILMGGQTNMSSILDLLIREAPSIMNAERATIFLADHKTEELFSHVAVGLMSHEIRIPWESGIAGWVFTHGQSLNIANPYEDPRFNKDVDPQTGFTTKSLLCVPLRCPGGPVLGAFQVLNKRAGVFTSTDSDILEILASQAARSIEQAMEWDQMRQRSTAVDDAALDPRQVFKGKESLEEIVGISTGVRDVRALIRKVAPTDSTVLIYGESGTGKELVARAIHNLSPRVSAALITLNCAAVPSELIESELFGHKKGSFTGAVAGHRGVFRAAHKGTLFLDEIEATSPAMQVKLLRAIQVGEVKPVGENTALNVDVRLVAATNQDLAESVERGFFREDLYYRVHVFPIFIPPLRERREDIPMLIRHFLDLLEAQTQKVVRGVDPVALDLLMRYSWPGNIRELENEIERAHILTPEGSNISVRTLSPRITDSMERLLVEQADSTPLKLKDAIQQLEQKMVQESLKACGGNRSVAAKRLGLSRQGLINKIAKFGL